MSAPALKVMTDAEPELRDIPGYEGMYAITRDGRVWAYPRKWVAGKNIKFEHRGIWLKPVTGTHGYQLISLYKGKGRQLRLHRVVALTWIENPRGLSDVNHINGIKADCRVSNLEWCTSAENSRHARRAGLINFDTETYRASVRRNAAKARAVMREKLRLRKHAS